MDDEVDNRMKAYEAEHARISAELAELEQRMRAVRTAECSLCLGIGVIVRKRNGPYGDTIFDRVPCKCQTP